MTELLVKFENIKSEKSYAQAKSLLALMEDLRLKMAAESKFKEVNMIRLLRDDLDRVVKLFDDCRPIYNGSESGKKLCGYLSGIESEDDSERGEGLSCKK